MFGVYFAGRFFGAMFTKLGIPIPTQIIPKVLAQAKELCTQSPDATCTSRLFILFINWLIWIFCSESLNLVKFFGDWNV